MKYVVGGRQELSRGTSGGPLEDLTVFILYHWRKLPGSILLYSLLAAAFHTHGPK